MSRCFALAVALLVPLAATAQTSNTLAPLPETIKAITAPPAQTAPATTAVAPRSTETEWLRQPYGEMGVAYLENAPFPDESRRNGFKGRSGLIPYDGHYDDNAVVFVIPNGYKQTRETDIIVHFHGHKNEARRAVGTYHLGEQLDKSARNAILILPQGPKDASDSSGGKLEREGVFRRFIDEALGLLKKEKRIPQNAQVADIILSAHSGGYQVLGSVLAVGGITNHVREAWLFDAAYGGLDKIAAPFARPNSSARLRSIFTQHLMEENVQLMSSLSTAGAKIFVALDDDLTTRGTSDAQIKSGPMKRENARPEKDELPVILQREPNVFLSTKLSHDELVFRRRYFEVFAHSSPTLEPTGDKESHENGNESGP